MEYLLILIAIAGLGLAVASAGRRKRGRLVVAALSGVEMVKAGTLLRLRGQCVDKYGAEKADAVAAGIVNMLFVHHEDDADLARKIEQCQDEIRVEWGALKDNEPVCQAASDALRVLMIAQTMRARSSAARIEEWTIILNQAGIWRPARTSGDLNGFLAFAAGYLADARKSAA